MFCFCHFRHSFLIFHFLFFLSRHFPFSFCRACVEWRCFVTFSLFYLIIICIFSFLIFIFWCLVFFVPRWMRDLYVRFGLSFSLLPFSFFKFLSFPKSTHSYFWQMWHLLSFFSFSFFFIFSSSPPARFPFLRFLSVMCVLSEDIIGEALLFFLSHSPLLFSLLFSLSFFFSFVLFLWCVCGVWVFHGRLDFLLSFFISFPFMFPF